MALALVLVTACVDGGDVGDAAAQGALGGPCFTNNTCNGALVCTLVNGKGVCLEGDASTQDATNDTTVSDAPADVTSDAPSDADAGCSLTPSVACANMNCTQTTQGCCLKSNQCTQNATACGDQNLWWSQCSSNADCTTALPLCCAPIASITGSCPAIATITSNATCSYNACPTNARMICKYNADCAAVQLTICQPTQVAGSQVTIGMCF